MSRILGWLAQLPSTNARVVVTLASVTLTTLVYLVLACVGRSWEPSDSWLMFLAVMSGVDGAVFFAKRKTQHLPSGPDGKSSDGNSGASPP